MTYLNDHHRNLYEQRDKAIAKCADSINREDANIAWLEMKYLDAQLAALEQNHRKQQAQDEGQFA